MLKSEHCSSNNETTATEEAFNGFSIVQTKPSNLKWCHCSRMVSQLEAGLLKLRVLHPSMCPYLSLSTKVSGALTSPSTLQFQPEKVASLQLHCPHVRDQRPLGSAEELPL